MKSLVIIGLLLFVAPMVLAQNWEWQNPLPQGEWLNDVCFIDTSVGWAVGNNSMILHTTNSGAEWSIQPTPVSSSLRGADFVDNLHGWCVGTAGIILKTNNGGATWVRSTSGSTRDLYDVDFMDVMNGWVCGANGTILRTTNGGTTWSVLTTGTTNYLGSIIFVDANNGWCCGQSGTILHTTDGGNSWSTQNCGISAASISFVDLNNGWACSSGGAVRHTTDGGASWASQSTGTSNVLTDILFTDINNGWMCGTLGNAYRTTNGGANWTLINSGTTYLLYGLAATDADHFWGVGNSGAMVHTSDGGANWVAQSSGPINNLYGISMADLHHGWAVGFWGTTGVIIHTATGTAPWVTQLSGVGGEFFAVSAVDSNFCWAVGAGGRIYRTTDGGSSWAAQSSGVANSLWGVFMLDAGTGWAVGDAGRILKTINGGVNWSVQTSGVTTQLNDVEFADARNGWVVGSYCILHTTNGGESWVTQSTGGTNEICVVDSLHAWVIGRRTTDGGATWTSQTTPYIGSTTGIDFVDLNNGWVSGQNGYTLHTTNGGLSWDSSRHVSSNYLMDIDFVDVSHGWIAGYGGIILSFEIPPPALDLISPNGGTVQHFGDFDTIRWTSESLTGNIQIEMNRSYPSEYWETLAASVPNTGSYPWLVTGPASGSCRVRVTSIAMPNLVDTSNADFSIQLRSITLLAPDGGEQLALADTLPILWNSENLTESVMLELNRGYPGAAWETLMMATPNTGFYPWVIAGPATTHARLRVSGSTHGVISDTSNADFSISPRTLFLQTPEGGEEWALGRSETITWISSALPGTLLITLNRNFPTGSWEVVATDVPNTGSFPWLVSGSETRTARVRISSQLHTAWSDTSAANFTIYDAEVPPDLTHDPLHDQTPDPFVVTCHMTDDAPGAVVEIRYGLSGSGLPASTFLEATGNGAEYAATIPALPEGLYEYDLRAEDVGGRRDSTPVSSFRVARTCGVELSYDDGTAERSNWADNLPFQWAVKFDPPVTPYILCGALVGVSTQHPDTAHSAMRVTVYLNDGPGGLPGTIIASREAGSLGNIIGGITHDPDPWVAVALRDSTGAPFVLNSPFYIAVSNTNGREAFLQDTSGTLAGRSYVFGYCDSLWRPEVINDDVARRGNRMIRISGCGLVPPASLVIQRQGSNLRLDWSDTGAPYYRIFSAPTWTAPDTTLVGSSTTNYFIVPGNISSERKFFRVRAATQP